MEKGWLKFAFLSPALALVIMGCSPTPALPAAAGTAAPAPASAMPTAELRFVALDVHQAFFNPDKANPVFLNMMSSFEFVNQHPANLEIKYPEFKLTINGIPWTDLVSTDFQIGRLPPQATQSIELQSVLYMNKLTPAQKDVLELIKAGQPVDLKLSGTIEVYPNGQKKILDVEFMVDKVVLSESWN